VSRPCTPCGRDRGTFPNVAGPTHPPTCHAREAGAAAIGHADRPDQVERKTIEYPSRERGVKAGPGWPGPGCTQSAARPHAWQEGTPARRSPPPARRCPDSPSLYHRTQACLPGSGWRRALFMSSITRCPVGSFRIRGCGSDPRRRRRGVAGEHLFRRSLRRAVAPLLLLLRPPAPVEQAVRPAAGHPAPTAPGRRRPRAARHLAPSCSPRTGITRSTWGVGDRGVHARRRRDRGRSTAHPCHAVTQAL
jgi:hypothetical protein